MKGEEFSFGLKLSFKKRDDAAINYVSLEHTEDGHNKFYRIRVLDQGNSPLTNYTVAVNYGKHDVHGSGSEKRHGFKDKSEAYKFLNKKLNEKLKKGYKRIK